MVFIIFVWAMSILQWLSIWNGVVRIKKEDREKRKRLFHKTFCSIGLPALISFIISIPFLFFRGFEWIALIILLILDIVFAINGTRLTKVFFK